MYAISFGLCEFLQGRGSVYEKHENNLESCTRLKSHVAFHKKHNVINLRKYKKILFTSSSSEFTLKEACCVYFSLTLSVISLFSCKSWPHSIFDSLSQDPSRTKGGCEYVCVRAKFHFPTHWQITGRKEGSPDESLYSEIGLWRIRKFYKLS